MHTLGLRLARHAGNGFEVFVKTIQLEALRASISGALATLLTVAFVFSPACHADIAKGADAAGTSALAGVEEKAKEIEKLDTDIEKLKAQKLATKDKAQQEQIESEIKKKEQEKEDAYKQVSENINSFKQSSELAAKARAADDLNSEMSSAAKDLKSANEAVEKAVQAHHEAVMEKTGLKPDDIGTEKWDQALNSTKSERAPYLEEINKAMDSQDAARAEVTDLRDAAGQMAAADFSEKASAAYKSASEGNFSEAASNAWEAVSGKNVQTAATGINALDGKFPEAAPLTPVAAPETAVATAPATQAGINLSGETPTFTPSSGAAALARTATGSYQGGGQIQYFGTGANSGYAVYPDGSVYSYTGKPGSAVLGTVGSTGTSAVGKIASSPSNAGFSAYTPYSSSSPVATTSTGVAARSTSPSQVVNLTDYTMQTWQSGPYSTCRKGMPCYNGD